MNVQVSTPRSPAAKDNTLGPWCLWLEDIEPSLLRSLSSVKERVENVKKIREKSSRPQLANIPHLFAQITQPKGLDFILIPRHSSENRKYIPFAFLNKDYIDEEDSYENKYLYYPPPQLLREVEISSHLNILWLNSETF